MRTLDTHDSLLKRFQDIARFLKTNRPLWETRPFIQYALPWEKDLPDAARWLRSLSIDAIDILETDDWTDPTVPPDLRCLQETSVRLSAVPFAHHISHPLLDNPKLQQRIPGRKWRQIKAFSNTAIPIFAERADHIVDWCAGKGHLGRTLGSISGLPVTAIEKRPQLCETGKSEASLTGTDAQFVVGNAHDPDIWDVLQPTSVAVGLHACGVLTDRLIEQVITRKVGTLLCAPCCYHALNDEFHYRPLSTAGQVADLPLTQHHLRLATNHEIVARPALRIARRQEMIWRLGLDLLLREGTGEDRYHRQGNFPRSVLKLPFKDFCLEASKRLQLPLPTRWSAETALEQGRERMRVVRALALMRGLFRRPLELWLVLDRALLLAEEDRHVTIQRFCDESVSPRNLLVSSLR